LVSSAPSRLTATTLAGSAALSVGLFAGHWLTHSQLAFAHFADSFLDLVATAVLVWTVKVSSQPADDNHHFGHQRAQPLGALVTAILTGMLAFEVVKSAVTSLVTGQTARLAPILLALFAGKAALKLAIWAWGHRIQKRTHSPAVQAIVVDSKNDVLSASLAIVGYWAAGYGYPRLDAWLALPVGVAIAFSGFKLALENVKLLMGEAPPRSLQRELVTMAQGVAGVRGTGPLRVHYVGTELHAHVVILVERQLTVSQAHDIGEAVRRRLETDSEVARCSVHIDPA
jgi:cation diffusion facilitator family transporter